MRAWPALEIHHGDAATGEIVQAFLLDFGLVALTSESPGTSYLYFHSDEQRSGAAAAMRDCFPALAVHPLDYLVVPRTLAMVISMPLLVAEAVGIGIVAGYFVAIFLLEVNGTYYVANMVRWTQLRDIIMALSKGFVFALLIVFISCHKGLTAREGAVGVGRATTEAVVNASLAVLIFNFFLTMGMNIIFPAGYQ